MAWPARTPRAIACIAAVLGVVGVAAARTLTRRETLRAFGRSVA